jgi:hypothetical protein
MRKANILLDNQSTGLTIIEKMDFESVDNVHSALLFAFHPEELGEDEFFDDRFMALWHIFLASVGWTDDEFWSEYKSRPHNCPSCGVKTNAEGDHVDNDGNVVKNETPPESKPN